MDNGNTLWAIGSLLVVVLGWIVYQVNGNSKANKDDERRLSVLETNMSWIREAIRKIAQKLDITEIG